MSKHETLIRSIAEEMANKTLGKTEDGKSWLNEILTTQDREGEIEHAMDYARIAAKYMADSFKLGAKWSVCKAWTGKELEGKLKEDGLIPDQEAGNS